ncbi:hypothetical protein FB45DRAFT_871159 [Roridomyces roridus]|uniref:Uncharacterized protein n=1 Tax=Roridomyces roridus TaxID=1738132 RepID=A0AAD7BGI3_9AGAR|nr:hypothetical protein FB45DRAFT_871159 [Roridomyces roridus]
MSAAKTAQSAVLQDSREPMEDENSETTLVRSHGHPRAGLDLHRTPATALEREQSPCDDGTTRCKQEGNVHPQSVLQGPNRRNAAGSVVASNSGSRNASDGARVLALVNPAAATNEEGSTNHLQVGVGVKANDRESFARGQILVSSVTEYHPLEGPTPEKTEVLNQPMHPSDNVKAQTPAMDLRRGAYNDEFGRHTNPTTYTPRMDTRNASMGNRQLNESAAGATDIGFFGRMCRALCGCIQDPTNS